MFPRMQFKQNGIKQPGIKQIGTLCLAIVMGVLTGCGFSQAQSTDSDIRTDKLIQAKSTMTDNDEAQQLPELVPVSAIKFNGNTISAGVVSFGCTTSADFSVEHAIVDGVCEVKINRVNRDVCRRTPFVANIELDWSQPEECGDLNIVVANPLLVTTDDNSIKKQMK